MFKNDKTKITFTSEIENGEFADTSVVKAATLESSDTQFQGKWVVNYVAAEIEEKKLKADGTQVATCISWNDLEYVCTMGSVDCYEWCSDTGETRLRNI